MDPNSGLGKVLTKALDLVSRITGPIVSYPLKHYPDDDRVFTLDFPGYRQTQTYTCGFVAALMVMHYFYPGKSARKLFRQVQPRPKDGTPVYRVIRALRANGIRVSDRRDLNFQLIASFIKKGMPILTAVRTSVGDGHWVAIYGVGYAPQRVFVAGTGVPYIWNPSEMPWTEFREIWQIPGEGQVCSHASR